MSVRLRAACVYRATVPIRVRPSNCDGRLTNYFRQVIEKESRHGCRPANAEDRGVGRNSAVRLRARLPNRVRMVSTHPGHRTGCILQGPIPPRTNSGSALSFSLASSQLLLTARSHAIRPRARRPNWPSCWTSVTCSIVFRSAVRARLRPPTATSVEMGDLGGAPQGWPHALMKRAPPERASGACCLFMMGGPAGR